MLAEENIFHVFNARGGVEVVRSELELNERLKEKTVEILRREVAKTFANRTEAERVAAAFSQMEIDRRNDEERHTRAERLARKTTWIAASVGAIATVVGTVLGVWLSA